MSFWGNKFVFDGIPSELYSLYISSPDGGDVNVDGSSDVSLQTESVLRRSKVYLLGVQQTPTLSFEVSFNTYGELTVDESGAVNKWLFGHMEYKKLQIDQDDMQGVYYNCFLTNPRTHMVGNIIRGIKATVVCDAPWGWNFERTLSNIYTDSNVEEEITFNNLSENNDYMYPKLEITVNEFGGGVEIVNTNDSDRSFSFTGLSAGEVLTIDNSLNIISSSTGLRRLSNFNKNWFRMIAGINVLDVTGQVEELDIIYQFARKVSG